MTAATATQTATTLRVGAVVIYDGSLEEYHGILFQVADIGRMTSGSPVKYSLTYYGDDALYPQVILAYVNRASLTRIPAKQVKTRRCHECGIHYFQAAEHGVNPGGCPMCALPEATGF
jgi:hypothetical protein